VQSFVECSAGEVLARIVRKNLPDAPTDVAQAATAFLPAREDQSAGPMPIAIVSLGCVLPGARDVDELWRSVNEGVSGIAELTVLDPTMAEDFLSAGDVVPDKAYSLLAGVVRDIEPDPRLPYSLDEFQTLTRAQRLLANALAQCVHSAQTQVAAGEQRVHCLLGSTADGIKEYDEALAMEIVRRALGSLDEPRPLKQAFGAALDGVTELEAGVSDALAPYPAYSTVVERVVGANVRVVLLDAACASSLYALDSAMTMLESGESDVVLAGGVFSPGPGINVLFGQFKALSASGCYPFDTR